MKKVWIAIVLLVVFLGAAFVLQLKTVTSNAEQLDVQILNRAAVSSPNIKLGNRVKMNADLFGGKFMYKQTKDINGYIIPWSDTYASYTGLGNDVQAGRMGETNGSTVFAEGTSQKMLQFYNPDISYGAINNDLQKLSDDLKKVMEVAISFDKSYELQDILEKIPSNLNIAWLWVVSENTDGVLDMDQVYGFEGLQKPVDHVPDSKVYQANYRNFVAGLDSLRTNSSKADTLYEVYSKLDLNAVKFKGIILTGQATNFKQIAGQSFIRASEIGATADIVPYIKPYK
ncbi:hypothetical protein PCORN_12312 [Listeria cornellensis FSL F6-0969]|uniref:Sigma factor regulator C-terminal domain-containing protein n=2 Tax=Listeria cornellensis TaxID=1494961 RepID=W7BMA4_9LIST|nr:hypothetical protein PCORN_12312 [Listeria cornellensis FSL F6-0969]